MADTDGSEALARVLIANDAEVVARLRLSAAEAARVCRVTPRQLIYWTRKGFVRTAPDSEHDYDVFAMEKVIRIRQGLERGQPLERAAQTAQRDIDAIGADIQRISRLEGDELEAELRRRLERLEDRVASLRRILPVSLELSRLRRAVALLARLEAQGHLEAGSANGDTAKALTLRLGRVVDELEHVIKQTPSPA